MRKTLVPLIGALALLFLLPDAAMAQRYGGGYGYGPAPRPQFGYRHRFHGYVGGQVMGMAMVNQTLETTGHIGAGGGFGLFGGLRLGPFVAVELNWTYTVHDESWSDSHGTEYALDALQLQTLTGDVKIHIPTRGRFEPYVQGGAGFCFLGVTGDYYNDGYIYQSGPAWNLGGGGDFWFSPFFTLGGRVLYRGMYFTEGDYDNYRPEKNVVHGLTFEFNAALHF